MKMISVVSACCREQPGGSSSRNTANEEGQYNAVRRYQQLPQQLADLNLLRKPAKT
jgi:hypothetical protein